MTEQFGTSQELGKTQLHGNRMTPPWGTTADCGYVGVYRRVWRWCLAGLMMLGSFSNSAHNAEANWQNATNGPSETELTETELHETKVTVIVADTVLVPGTDYGRLEIAASNITIDGQGCVLRGGESNEDKLPSSQRQGIAIQSSGQNNVVLKNIIASGWETGLKLTEASGWTIDNCDFSDNFHDPEFGWGENGRRGGIVFERVQDSTIRHCKANRVWDACVLVDSDRNQITKNDFSHTSNTCLKLWYSSHNQVHDNNLSYGIRIRTGEVHARDSTGVLIENGSNHNTFVGNDCTHGGDGIFIRVLNGWVSTDNHFAANDCSYANNNGFECWAPRNTFVGNKANHCSYGFWLGGSDQTRLINNEASFNGRPDGFHNSPHLPGNGHAGIVFMFGSSSHVVAYGNRCQGNEGAGIALIGDLQSNGAKWKAYHWVIAGNYLIENRWGIFAQHADWVTLVGNHHKENLLADLQIEDNVSRLSTRSGPGVGSIGTEQEVFVPNWYMGQNSVLELKGPASSVVGKEVQFELDTAGGEFSRFEWDLGGLTGRDEKKVSAKFEQPGFYRIGVTASGTSGIDLAYRDFYVVSDAKELVEDHSQWSFEAEPGLGCTFHADVKNVIHGNESTRISVQPYHGGVVRFVYPSSQDAAIPLNEKSRLSFWVKANNPNLPGWQSNNPEVTLYGQAGQRMRIAPVRDMMQQQAYSEAREGWRYISVPLASDADWTYQGNQVEILEYFTLGFDSWGGDPLEIWIDGVVLE